MQHNLHILLDHEGPQTTDMSCMGSYRSSTSQLRVVYTISCGDTLASLRSRSRGNSCQIIDRLAVKCSYPPGTMKITRETCHHSTCGETTLKTGPQQSKTTGQWSPTPRKTAGILTYIDDSTNTVGESTEAAKICFRPRLHLINTPSASCCPATTSKSTINRNPSHQTALPAFPP